MKAGGGGGEAKGRREGAREGGRDGARLAMSDLARCSVLSSATILYTEAAHFLLFAYTEHMRPCSV
jgi:hypothetical protein